MKVVIRADASREIGSGHVMRCLVLAEALKARGAEVRFVCRAHPGHLGDTITARGFVVDLLPVDPAWAPSPGSRSYAAWLGTDQEDDAQETLKVIAATGGADLMVVDHYGLDVTFERRIRPHVGRILVIDDLADRPHDCDVLLDQNYGRQATDYSGLVSDTAVLCIGPSWALLRSEFAKHRSASLERRANAGLRTILVTMGGGDLLNLTSRTLRALSRCQLAPSTNIRVVLGPLARDRQAIEAQAARMPVPTHVLVGISNMADEMTHADLAIGAGGGTSWERCCLGLPAVVAPLAENQRFIIKALAVIGAVWAVKPDKNYEAALEYQIMRCLEQPSRLAQTSVRAATLCDGEGALRFIGLITAEKTST